MKIITKTEFLDEKNFLIDEMKKGKILIYPTDTIYGIGCDATSYKAVSKIREIKRREEKPFSIIAPSKEWIRETCFISERHEEWLQKLPGHYTLILKLKNKGAVSSNVNNSQDTIGIRIPDNWFGDIIKEFGKPFVTTSVNLSGEKHVESILEIKKSISEHVDYIIDEGVKRGNPSVIVDLTGEKEKIFNR